MEIRENTVEMVACLGASYFLFCFFKKSLRDRVFFQSEVLGRTNNSFYKRLLLCAFIDLDWLIVKHSQNFLQGQLLENRLAEAF